MLWAHRDLLMIVEGFSETPGGSGECDRRCAMLRATAAGSGIRGVLAKKIQWREAAVRRPLLRRSPKEGDYW